MNKRFSEQLNSKWAGKELLHLEETPSTNNAAKELAEKGAVHGTLIVANKQTAGRGRRGRNWVTAPGSSVAMSMLLRPSFAPWKASMVTLLQAMAVAKAVEEVCGVVPGIKWPNDILVNEKKVCGILTELHMQEGGSYALVVGCGVNVNQEAADFPAELAGIATSLKAETGQSFSPETLIAGICEKFELLYEKFTATGNLAFLREEYNALLVSRERMVKVLDPKGEFTGKALGVNESGELLVEEKNGEVVKVYAGEVSVRGIYGYV